LESQTDAGRRQGPGASSTMKNMPAADMKPSPLPILKGLASLRRMIGTYPAGHPMIVQKEHELDDAVRQHLTLGPEVRIDIIRGSVHLDGVAFDDEGASQSILDLAALGVDSLHIREGVTTEELHALAEFLWQPRSGDEPVDAQLARRSVQHITVGKLVALDTRWRARQW